MAGEKKMEANGDRERTPNRKGGGKGPFGPRNGIELGEIRRGVPLLNNFSGGKYDYPIATENRLDRGGKLRERKKRSTDPKKWFGTTTGGNQAYFFRGGRGISKRP